MIRNESLVRGGLALALSLAFAGCGKDQKPYGGCVAATWNGSAIVPVRNDQVPPSDFTAVSATAALSVPLPEDSRAAPQDAEGSSIQFSVSANPSQRYHRLVTIELRYPEGSPTPYSELRIQWNGEVAEAYEIQSFEQLLPPASTPTILLVVDVFRFPAAWSTASDARVLGTLTLWTGKDEHASQQGAGIQILDDQSDPTPIDYALPTDPGCGELN